MNITPQPEVRIFLDHPPGHHEWVRQRRLSSLERIEAEIMKKILHDPSVAVRGKGVAVDSLLEALIDNPFSCRYSLIVHPQFFEHTKRWLISKGGSLDDDGGVRIISALNFPNVEIARRSSAWLSLSGSTVPLEMRGRCGGIGAPIAIVTHGLSLHTMLHDWFLKIFLTARGEYDSIICATHASQKALSAALGYVGSKFNAEFGTRLRCENRTDLIPLCVDTERLKPKDKVRCRRQLGLPKRAFILLFLGRLAPQKADLLPFLKVFKLLVEKNSKRDLLWLIAGTDNAGYLATLKAVAEQLNIKRHIRFINNVREDTKEILIPACDVFVCPSDTVMESFGLAPVEAMACGVPQVVPAWDGYRDTVSEGETGFLVPCYWCNCDEDLVWTGPMLGWEYDHFLLGQSIAVDLVAFQERLQCLIENEQLCAEMGERSRVRAVSLYSYRAVAKQYEQLFIGISAAGRQISSWSTTLHYNSPNYYQFFQHYASQILIESTQIALSKAGEAAFVAGQQIPLYLAPEGAKAASFDGELHRSIICRLHDAPCGSLFLRELVDEISCSFEMNPDRVRRHIMWLLKYGFITSIHQNGSAYPVMVRDAGAADH